MCGIAGIVSLAAGSIIDEARVVRMRDSLRHRGPDGAGLHIEPGVGLAHRRLAIVDVAGGHQPMSNEDGSLWITFNGEIYNHASLRPGLISRGHVYRSASDTETILHLYEDEGDACVDRLRGMFAFALWDRVRGRLFLARDRLGIKPLYYACTENEILFASEIKAILAAGPLRPELNRGILPEYLATRFVSGEETFFRGVLKLLPGRTLSWSPGEGFRKRRYWSLSADSHRATVPGPGAALEVRERLENSVRSHLMSDVPVGLFLSGGIDSTAVAGLMAPMMREPLHTFSVGFDDPATSELAWARLAARSVGSSHRETVVSPREFWSALPRLIWHEDEPIAFTSSVPLYFLSRLASEHVKVVLSGEGADELFLGYNRYRITLWNDRLGRASEALLPTRVRRHLRRLAGQLPRRLRRYAERSFLSRSRSPRDLFFENFSIFPEAMRHGLLGRELRETGRDPYSEGLRSWFEARDGPLSAMASADLQTYLVELLMKQDQMSMAASIESRVPFLDSDFVAFTASLPGELKVSGWRTKSVLRAAIRDRVPRAILHRKKMGFPVPVSGWLRGPFRHLVDEFAVGERALRRGLFEPGELTGLAREHVAGAADHGERLWLLINLEIWQRIFLDGEDPHSMGERVHA